METFFIIIEVLKAISISLGVGSSTLAIALYLGSLSNDGKIDKSEKRMLGVVYTVLRLSMVLIFITHLITNIPLYMVGGAEYLVSPLNFIQWLILLILYVNALLMTAHIMPDTYGPGIQVATWFSLGVITVLGDLVVIDISIFIMSYIVFTILAIWLIGVFKRDLKVIQKRKRMLR